MTVPYTFANATGNISLSELDVNFANVKAAADTAGTVTTNAQPNITSVGVLNSLSVSGNITSGNISGNFIGTVGNATYSNTAGTANTANTVTVNAQPNITSVGTLTELSVAGNISAGNITGNVAVATYANTAGTVTTNAQPNITSVGVLLGLSVVGTITTDVESISGNSISGPVNEAVYSLGAETVTANAQPNITSVGSLESLDVSGNVTISGITKLGTSNASAIGSVTGSVGDIVAITDSPGNGGQLAYWDTTNSRWSYVFDNSAV